MMATAFLSYSGPFNQDFRLLLNKNWMNELKQRKILFTADINIVNMLTNQTMVCFLLICIYHFLPWFWFSV